MTGTSIRTGTTVAAGLAALAAAAALAAPAGATATRVGVDPGISFGSATNYGTGCGYDIDGYVDDPSAPVVFYDNTVPFAFAYPSGGLAQAHWIPATPGPHRLQIVQHSRPGDDVFPYVDVTVGVGLLTGSGCAVTN